MRFRTLARSVAVIAVLGIVAAACSSKSPASSNSNSPGSAAPSIPQGGKIVLGAEQYPECLNPVTQCASASWLYWSSTMWVMPRAMVWGLDGKPAASPLLAETPTLDNGDLTSNPFVVKFKINPKAVWADGTPITCADFDFTRNAIINSKGTYSTLGYIPIGSVGSPDYVPGITSIDCSTPSVAVQAYSGPFADWADNFGGGTGFLLEKAAFPNEANSTKVDLSKEMQNLTPFSGGPWKMTAWSQQQTVLVPNDKYWVKHANGKPTYFDQVTIVPRTDATTEVNDLLSGAIDGIFPQPDVSQAQQFKSNPNVKFRGDPGNYYEALWFNVSKPPFDDKTVREAMYWAVDRTKVLQNLITPVDPSQSQPLGCGIWAYPGTFYCDKQPFAQFHYDVNQVSQIMTAGGYAKDSKGFWAKGGKEVAFEYDTTTKPRRITTQALLKEGLTAAGFNVTTKALDATLLFETKLPHGDFQLADFAEGGIPDPTVTGNMSCSFIPTAKNGYAGSNDFHWCNKQASTLMGQSDGTVDPTARRALLDQVYALEASDFAPGIPLYVLPNVTAWRTDKLAGPVGIWNPTVYGGWYNAQDWYCAKAGACG